MLEKSSKKQTVSDCVNPLISLLIIDDSPESLDLLSSVLAQPYLEILTATDPENGLEIAFRRRPQIVLTDLIMPRLNGLEVLKRLTEVDPAMEVLLMTAHYSAESAVEAIKSGASDYLTKPLSIPMLRERIGKMILEARQRRWAINVKKEQRENAQFEGIVGRSQKMWDLFSRISRVAPHYRTLLITGETGTGKDLVAQAIHKLSPAASGRYVVLNCSAVVDTLFESELFGHLAGSFTGATHDKPGLIEHADGGTLFLDEIGDMPLALQAKLLRVLQNREVQRVGALSPRKVDIRVIAATNQNLVSAIGEKRFREDLYYRLSMVEIPVPRLADRKEDLSLLERHFVARFAAEYKKEVRGLTHRAQIWLSRHSWPGNVRELENVMGHAVMMTLEDTVDVPNLPPYLCPHSESDVNSAPQSPPEDRTLQNQERLLLMRALVSAGGNQAKAARLLQIGRGALRYRIKKHSFFTSVAGDVSAASA